MPYAHPSDMHPADCFCDICRGDKLETQNIQHEFRSEAEQYNYKEDNQNMLPQPGGGKTQSQRTSDGSRRRATPSVPFLKVEDLTQEPKRAKILGVQTQNAGFNDLIVKVAISGRSFFFGLKASNPNYDALFSAFGADENKWVGEEFLVGLNWNEFYEKNFIHVFEAPAPKEASSAKKK